MSQNFGRIPAGCLHCFLSPQALPHQALPWLSKHYQPTHTCTKQNQPFLVVCHFFLVCPGNSYKICQSCMGRIRSLLFVEAAASIFVNCSISSHESISFLHWNPHLTRPDFYFSRELKNRTRPMNCVLEREEARTTCVRDPLPHWFVSRWDIPVSDFIGDFQRVQELQSCFTTGL